MRLLLKGRPAPALALGAVALAIAAAGGAYAASRGDGTITVCVSHKSGALYKASKCKKHDKKLSWNKQGPQGPQGPAGKNGTNGTNGTNGAVAAYSTFHDGAIAMSSTLGTIGSLSIPSGGSYVINATLTGKAHGLTSNPVTVSCQLAAGGDTDIHNVGAPNGSATELVLQVAHTFTAAGTATLSCEDFGSGDDAIGIKITALRVSSLTNTGF